MNRLNKPNIKNVYSYIDLLRSDTVKIEVVIQDLEKVRGLSVKADQLKLQQARTLLIKAQEKIDQVKVNLHKSNEFKFKSHR